MDVPEAITRYFDAAAARDTDGVVAAMAPDVVVVDDGTTWTGHDGVRAWKAEVTSAFDYTTTVTGLVETGESSYVATAHLVGTFPGGEVDLRYAFTLADGLVARLEIGV